MKRKLLRLIIPSLWLAQTLLVQAEPQSREKTALRIQVQRRKDEVTGIEPGMGWMMCPNQKHIPPGGLCMWSRLGRTLEVCVPHSKLGAKSQSV